MAMQQGSDDLAWGVFYALFQGLFFPLFVFGIMVFYVP